MVGTVKWWNDAKGFGFIKGEQKDVFVHFSEIKASGRKTLMDGQEVEYEIQSSPKGPVAKNVIPKEAPF